MISPNGQSSAEKTPLGRMSPLPRTKGRAVTVEEVIDADDYLHRVRDSSSVSMGSAQKEVSPDWYTYTGNDAHKSADPSAASLENSSAAPKNASETTVQAAAWQDPEADQETPKPTPRLENHGMSAVNPDINSAPPEPARGASTPQTPPRNVAGEHKPEFSIPTPLATAGSARTPSPGIRHFPPNGPGLHSPVNNLPWQYQPMHGHSPPRPAQFVPPYPPHFPTSYPPDPGFGYSWPPPPPPHHPSFMPGKHVIPIDIPAMTGYELLASRLAGSSDTGPPIPPLYRRFKELHHRVLLVLQDELCHLEEILQNLDNADSFNRRYRDGFLPASRRHDNAEPTDVITARKSLVEQIAHKLFQYNTQLDLFKSVIEFRHAMPEDVHDYKTFLAAATPVVPLEMRFLDKSTDLMCLPDTPFGIAEECTSGDTTPVEPTSLLEVQPAPSVASATDRHVPPLRIEMTRRPRRFGATAVRSMALAICMTFLLPILSFPVIPGFVSRMTVVGLVALATGVVSVQSGVYQAVATKASGLEGAAMIAVYVGFMAIVAGTFG